MNYVANLENCQKLYELSGWKDTTLRFIVSDDKFPRLVSQVNVEETDELYRAYDLGYLLRKLPDTKVVNCTRLGKPEDCYEAQFFGKSPLKYIDSPVAATPEDAACLLAIKLFEEGILKK